MENLLVGSVRYLELFGSPKKLAYLMFNLPYECNYRCLKCCNYNREKLNSRENMSLGEIYKMLDEAAQLGIRVFVIAGEGEPFMHPNIREIIQKAESAGLIPYIFTNGSMLMRDLPQFLKEHNASLIINLDSLKKEVYEQHTQIAGSFEVVSKNLENLRELFEDTHSKINGHNLRRIAINTVLSTDNIEELPKIQTFCGDDFAFVYNSPIQIGRAENNPKFIPLEANMRNIPLGTSNNGCWCAYMRNGISVGVGGEILLCAYSIESSGTLGNIREGGLKKHIGTANSAFDSFYGTDEIVSPRCVLRSKEYAKFIDMLKIRK